MEVELEVPREVPVMTMQGTVLFPQAMMPLRIFEPRYRAMLTDVLSGDRLFAVGCRDEAAEAAGQFEPLKGIAGVGIVRASQQNDDGTSNLVLQGLARVKVLRIAREEPYRKIEVALLRTRNHPGAADAAKLRERVLQLVKLRRQYGGEVAGELPAFLRDVADAEAFADLAGFALCPGGAVKQTLLETLDLTKRYLLLVRYLEHTNELLRLEQRLRRGLPGGDATLN